MHAIVPVIHTENLYVYGFFEKYLDSNEEYFEKMEISSKEDALAFLAKRRKNENNSDWADSYDNMTDQERLEEYCDDYNYQMDDDNIYEEFNPNGICDWYEIGGRWDKMLVNYNGEKANSMKITDFNYQDADSIKNVYGYILDYNDDDYFEVDESDTGFKDIIEEAKRYGESNGIDLYITLVDIHQ
jgi:hypothetical protein